MRYRASTGLRPWVVPAAGLLAGACAVHPRFQGPLPVRNQHPAQQLVQHLAPVPTASLPAGAVAVRGQLAYTSLWLTGQKPDRTWRMDGEYLRAAAMLRAGLGRDLELAAELPFAHTSGGFLDHFIIGYHDLFGFPDQHRDEEPKDEFEVAATRTGETVWSVDRSSLELLDVPIDLKWTVAAPAAEHPGLALRGGLELPLGDDAHGYGSGRLDATLGVLVEQSVAGVNLVGHAQYTWAGTPAQARAADFSFADVTAAGLAAEVPVLDGLNALVQIEWETSTLRRLDLPAVSRNQLLLWVGGRADLGDRWRLEIALGEDLADLVSPDFTATAALLWQ